MSFSEFLDSTNVKVLSENDPQVVKVVKNELVDENEPVYDVEPISQVKPVSVKKDLGSVNNSVKPGGSNLMKKCINKSNDCVKKESDSVKSVGLVIENGDFEEEEDWLLVGRTAITGLSTTKGRKLEDNEIVHFAFPNNGEGKSKSGYWVNSRAANAASGIVRFSTKRSGEIGRLPMEWSKCLIPLVNSKKVKVLGRCVAAPVNLTMMQEIMLYISFYIHHSIFTEDGQCTWKLESSSNIDTTIYPLLTLFKLLKKSPFQKAEFTPEELDSRKRVLTLETDLVGAASSLPAGKRRKGGEPLLLEPNDKDGQNITETSLNKLVGAADMYNLEILADAMGLGKTVMTISLILARPGKGTAEIENGNENESIKASQRPRGGTLIVCPMALLSQWKDELETHSEPNSISVFVHYGGERSNDPRVIAEPTVVLTTYGVLSASYKSHSENSIFQKVDWYRVVLDEAHTIKASKSQCAQAAFALSSYCRWCLTGTPLQNNLEDLYSLLCFLHVEPWCNWAWWNKLIQRPYENGDKRGLKLVKAILRPLMLRRTKDTKDKEGRPILVLPPTDIQVIECVQSEAEHDFYDALFKRSKVQFDQFVAQGKVLHNYANILELLLRLRQCCNHPFLVMSRGDSQQFSDLNKLARRFLDNNLDSTTPNPCKAYIEEVVDDLRRGENTECPICLESADDAVLTPCAHRMCRECLLSSWRSPVQGLCPICRQNLRKTDLITCPSDSKFRVDVEKNWKESSKVEKLLECLEGIRQKRNGEKSIVFSQWTSFLDLLEIPLKRRKIGFLRFDGSLSQKNREKTLREFSETNDKMVLLMSLKAGGVGLNLTAASNVFLMDPWWNPAVEEQAIMRIHRIGQKRTVCVRRFIVKDTIEERMQQVQARKQRMIAGALTDEEVRSARLEELKMLFR
ncbi:DNA/RNA helicase protein [Artemisia annua]|uniref:DNA/RNA helicase protein n=1 Tax=Artemisia annua TaxID=35608 RepID=A0A2U1N9C6_ARTAN|nr:DNA/RNA helicase protein [Artemisia annua]